jgi:hypothetical protein
LVEALIVLAVLAILVGLATAAISKARQASSLATCAANLRAIGQGFAAYANANSGVLPYVELSSPQWEDLLMAQGLTRRNFCCPADQEIFPSLGSSYDWRDTGKPDSNPALDHPNTFSGRQLSAIFNLNLVMSFESLPGWHKPHTVMAVHVDMSVDSMDETEFFDNLQCPATH